MAEKKKKWQPRAPSIQLGKEVPFIKIMPESKSWICYIPNFIDKKTADEHFQSMLTKIPFQLESSHRRKTAWLGKHSYTYSDKVRSPLPMPDEVAFIMQRVQDEANRLQMLYDVDNSTESTVLYNDVLAVLYTTGQDSVPYHRDAESTIMPNSPISSLSFGASRIFKMRPYKSAIHKAMSILPATMEIQLDHGALLIMGGHCQQHWSHGIDPDVNITGSRINYTFRVYNPGAAPR
jgi:alkylated DNA repair dioxygenase AlkB